MLRLLTALALIPAVTWVIFAAPNPLFYAVVAILALLCYREYTALVAKHSLLHFVPVGYAAGLVLLADPSWAVLLAALGLALSLRHQDLADVVKSAGAFTLGLIYVFGAWRSAIDLRVFGPHWLFFAVALNWAGDSAAYYVGKNFGRRRLAPSISPNKSVEGSVGSIVASMIFGAICFHYLDPGVPVWQVLVLSGAGNVAGQCGDLAESALKRGAGVKDSGAMLPGHGGWLDRLDSSLFSMPTVLILLRLMHPS